MLLGALAAGVCMGGVAIALSRQPEQSSDPVTPVAAGAAQLSVSCHDAITTAATSFKPTDVTVGPLTFIDLRVAARKSRRSFHPRHGRDRIWKAGAVLKAGTEVTVWIGPAARRFSSLEYRAATQDAVRVSQGDTRLTFVACRSDEAPPGGKPSGTTGWPGGFILHAAGCVPVRVKVAGQPGVLKATVGFGETCETD